MRPALRRFREVGKRCGFRAADSRIISNLSDRFSKGLADWTIVGPVWTTGLVRHTLKRREVVMTTPSTEQVGTDPWIVVIAASAGGVQALTRVLGALPSIFPAPIVVVQHRTARPRSLLASVLGTRTVLPVSEAEPGQPIRPGVVYVARPDLHLTVTDERRFAYVDGRRIHYVLSSANPLFESAAAVFGAGTVGVVLTGYGQDGTEGVQAIRAHGGVVIAQDRRTSEQFGMAASAIQTGAVDYVLPVDAIGPALVRLVATEPTPPAAHGVA